jgi:hypothetical protein
MLARIAIALTGLVAAAGPSLAQQALTPEEARRFVAGKLFSYSCFEGTRGAGRIYGDGSVVGSIQFQGKGPVKYLRLPAGTLQVKGGSVCANLRGMPLQPCFYLAKTDERSFRGSISGLGFAYCDFTRRQYRAGVVRASTPRTGSTAATAPATPAPALSSASASSASR